MNTYRSAKTVIALVFLAGLLTPAPSIAFAASTTYGGQATAVRATVAVAGIVVGPLSLADTGPIGRVVTRAMRLSSNIRSRARRNRRTAH